MVILFESDRPNKLNSFVFEKKYPVGLGPLKFLVTLLWTVYASFLDGCSDDNNNPKFTKFLVETGCQTVLLL